jgi:hypothetical protein
MAQEEAFVMFIKEKFKNMTQLQKQIYIISVCALLFAVLTLLYFLVLSPIIERLNTPVTFSTEYIEGDPDGRRVFVNSNGEIIHTLLRGEEILTFGPNHRFLVHPQVHRRDMLTVEVRNPNDNFKLHQLVGANFYYVEDAEMVPINQEIIASFFTNVGYLLCMERVAAKDVDNGNDILENRLADFGLNPEDPGTYFIVTMVDGGWYRIIIGDIIPTTGGYYVMYEDADGLRPAIYILDRMMDDTILSDRYAIMMPIISEPVGPMDMIFVTNFRFYKGRDLFVAIYNDEIPYGSNAHVNYQMSYPVPYEVSMNNYGALLNGFTHFTGLRVVYAYSPEEDITDEILIEYGFHETVARISFDLHDDAGNFRRDYYYAFSGQNEAGNYYVLTDFFSIVEVTPEMLTRPGIPQPFIYWDLIRFVDRPIFDQNINDVESILIKVPGKPDALFELEGVGQELQVWGNGVELDVPTPYFRGFYYSVLSIDIIDYQEDPVERDDLILLEMTVTNRNGVVRHYTFYFVEGNTRRSVLRLNDRADFYVLHDKVRKLAADTELMLQNLPIDRDAME